MLVIYLCMLFYVVFYSLSSTLDWIGEIYFHAWKVANIAGLDISEVIFNI